MPAIFFALISYLGWGIGDIFGTIATRRIGAYATSFWGYSFAFPIESLYIPFAIQDLTKLTPGILILNLFLGLLLLGAFVIFNEALRVGNASLVGAISASFGALVVLFSILFLGESINSKQIISILIIFLGVVFCSLNFKELKHKFALDKGVLLAIIAMLCWGIYFTFIKIL